MKRHSIRDKKTGRFVAQKNPKYMIKVAKPGKKVEEAIKILKAMYGVEGKMVEVEKVKIGRKASNRMAGSDPAPGQKKVLVVEADIKGKQFTVSFEEGTVVEF